jgi:hypothetical protein
MKGTMLPQAESAPDVGDRVTRVNNTIKNNTIANNGLDAEDRTVGARIAGTATTWQANVCKTSNPLGLCAK